ncbi:haloacid dehalogenase type II [Labrenzia sp. PHM005]|uniref:haloacid dehalogenase type II n=1 Tax=Stappiaceae TaxID=2821832 RepID=UPI00113FC8CC|nr:haloacid dehalogenase type II [Labrenzia sp. PHM005]QDG76950.1 haloacid dehalogenase type II [Labrenzia sp. PHM005]
MAYAAYVFDAYGTLFDVHAAVRKHAAKLGPDAQRLSSLWREKQLEYSWVRALMGQYKDFWELTQQGLDTAFELVPSADKSLKDDLLNAYWTLDCYPEVPQVLTDLKATGAKIAILSNGSPDMLEAAAKASGLTDLFDEIFSVDSLRTFKTDPQTYEMVTTHFRIYPEEVSFQSSNRWDVAGATAFGFRTVWMNRTGQPDEYKDLSPKAVLADLTGLSALV